MDGRTVFGILLCLTEYFTGHQSNIALTKQDKAQQVLDWVSLCPAEIGMGDFTCLVPKMEKYGGNRVRYGCTLGTQDAIAIDLLPFYTDDTRKLRSIRYPNL